MSYLEDKSKKATSSDTAVRQSAGHEAVYLQDNRPVAIQLKRQAAMLKAGPVAQKKENNTGLPDRLKSGIENLSGIAMDDVKVHYNSNQPAQLQALAYAQGTDIHIGNGQEKHLPHEAWHVVQQKQGRVKPNLQFKKGININDDEGLETEADIMGGKAAQLMQVQSPEAGTDVRGSQMPVIQRMIGPDRPLNSKVIHKATQQVYLIKSPSGPKGYHLAHYAINGPAIYALPGDDSFDFFAVPDLEPPSGIFSGIFSKEVPSVSGAYEKGRKEDIVKAWPVIAPQIEEIKQAAIKTEKLKPGSSAFYNAAGLGAHTLHRIILGIYEEIHGVSTRNHVFFRAPGNAPRKEALQGPEQFLNTRKPGAWSDHSERESMMSANISLSASTKDASESTFSILQSGGLFDVAPDKTVEIIGKMLDAMAITGSYAKVILVQVTRLATSIAQIKAANERAGTNESVLYQTFIPKGLVPKLVYIGQKNGHPLDYEYSFVNPEKVLTGMIAAGKELKDASLGAYGTEYAGKLERMNPGDKKTLFQSSKFTQMALEAAKAVSFWAVLNGDNDPQARVLMHPKVFAEPSGLAETVTHKNLSVRTSQTLDTGVDQIKGAVAGVRREMLVSITDNIQIYGAVFERYNRIIGELDTYTTQRLGEILKQITTIVNGVDKDVQQYIWDFIGANGQIKPLIKAGLKVKCRGKAVDFDLNVPGRMFSAEFEQLRELLTKLSIEIPAEKPAPVTPTKTPDLLDFNLMDFDTPVVASSNTTDLSVFDPLNNQ